MPNTLKNRTIHALLWSVVEAVSLQGVRLVIGIVLARMLFPAEFGVIGMVAIFTAVTQSLLDGGFVAALIQKRDATPMDFCSMFYFNILVGLMAAGLLCLAAPWIAAFYNQPILTPLTRALSLTIVIDSFGLIQSTLLTKQINFKTLAKVSLIVSALSGIVGIGFAVTGFGVWSLAIQQISGALVRTVCLWFYSSWRPALLFSFRSLRSMFGFGSRMLCSNLLNQVFDNVYGIVIGKLFSAADLGFFTRAKTLQELPCQMSAVVVGRVTLPVFAGIQDDTIRIKRGLRKAMTTLVLVNSPLMIGLAVIARPLVLVMLTEKWTPSIPYLQILCLAGLLFPLHVMNLNVLTALGRSDLFLRLEIIKKALVVLGIAVTWPWGVSAMIWGIVAISIVGYYVNAYYSGRLVGYPMLEQLRDLSSYLIAAVAMGVVTYGIGLLFQNAWPKLLGQIAVGAVTYVCLCRIFRLTAFVEIWQELRSRALFLRAGAS